AEFASSSSMGRLAVTHGDSVAIWDLDSAAPRYCCAAASPTFYPGASLSPDGNFLACPIRWGSALKLWDLRPDIPRLAKSLDSNMGVGHSKWVDNRTLLQGYQNGEVRILDWDGAILTEKGKFQAEAGYFPMVSSRQGKILATMRQEKIHIWALG